MGLFSSASGSKAKGKPPATPFPSEFLPPPPAPRRQRQLVNVLVHQAEWHWQHRQPLPYPDVTLPHDWHLDPDRIPVPAAPQSARAHAKEVRHRRALLTPEQRRDPAYATDSPNWARWFAFEHEEARRRGVCEVDRRSPPTPLVVREEDQAALAAVYRESEEDERRRAEAAEVEEEARYEAAMAQALALSGAGDSVVPPVAPPSPIKPEPQPEPEPEPIARFSWNGVVREWVSAPPVWLGATPTQEQAYLEMWCQRWLVKERHRGEDEEMLERDLEEEQRQAEKEER